MLAVLLLLVLTCVPAAAQAPPAQAPPAPKGHLVVVGGGGVPDAVLQRALQLAGGPAAPVVVLPQASELADTGEVACEMWRKAGATSCRWLNLRDLAADRKAVDAAALIWFPGGDQNNLTRALDGTTLPEAIRARYAAGAVVGGTSAGAAVMSGLMITGDADLQSITAGATKTAPGFGLWPDAIVDQHFLKRQRHSRLISLVLDHPALVGVGIDERTAAIVSNGRVEVVGESTVVIYDARKAAVEPRAAGQRAAARHVEIHILTDGMGWDSGQKTEDRRQKTEDGSRKAGDGTCPERPRCPTAQRPNGLTALTASLQARFDHFPQFP